MLPQLAQSMADNPCYVVCDRGTDRSRLQVFTLEGEHVRTIPIPAVELVSGLTGTQDRKLILVDSIRGDVRVLNEFGDLLFIFNTGMNVSEPADIALHNGHFYICDFQSHYVGVFNQMGEFVRRIGHNIGLLNFPNGIDVANSGEILVADSHGNQLNLNVFEAESGHLLANFQLHHDKLWGCVGLKVHPDGRLLSLIKGMSRVFVMSPIELLE